MIPFLLFASFSGTLADRYSKRRIIYFTRFMEILTTSLGVLAFFLSSPFMGYAVLFLLATQSALFSPCKYGIIPEIVPKGQISKCNGIITATTYLAIIIGTFLASFLTEVSDKKFVLTSLVCVGIAIVGLVASFGIEKTQPQSREKKVSTRLFSDIWKSLKEARKERYLLAVIIFGAYFLFMGAYVQLNIIPYAIQALHLTEVHGGYLFLMTAIGIGLGSYLAGRLSGKEVEIGFIPLAALGVGLTLSLLFPFSHHYVPVAIILILLGVCGGFYIVPVDAFIQVASPDQNRGQNVATANFLSFIGVIFASGLLALLGNALNLSAATGFLVVGLITILMGALLLFLFADQVLRLLVAGYARLFLTIRVKGKNRIQPKQAVLLVAPRLSWLDTILVLATLPRLIRYIVPLEGRKRRRSILYRLLWLVPVDMEHFTPVGVPTIEAVEKELASGHSICLMHPLDLPTKTLQEWEERLENLLKNVKVPVLPIHIQRGETGDVKGRLSQLRSLSTGPICISYGNTRQA